MNKAVLPTFLGVGVILVGLTFGIILLQNLDVFRLESSADISPNSVRVTNQSDSSFSVSWTTNTKTKGDVLWGTRANNLLHVVEGDETYIHFVTILGLEPNSEYFFKVRSSGKMFGNSTQPWRTQTGPILNAPSNPLIITGSVLFSSGTPASDVLVHTNIDSSSTVTTKTKEDGSWILSLGYVRKEDLRSYAQIDELSSVVEINVLAGPLGAASAKIHPISAKPAPPITLGKAHDFRSLPISNFDKVPEANLSAPEESTSSGFEITPTSEIESEEK
jgi:hypothetical protein